MRKISLTPMGVSSNLVFDHIINHLVKFGTRSADDTDENGNKSVIFIEVVGLKLIILHLHLFLICCPMQPIILAYLVHLEYFEALDVQRVLITHTTGMPVAQIFLLPGKPSEFID